VKAIVCREYGPASVLRLEEVPTPRPQDDELLIRIRASTVATSGSIMRSGRPFYGRLFTGLRRPKIPIPGTDLAGEVEAVGKNVTTFGKGDLVFAASDTHFSAHAEYICLPQNAAIRTMPSGMDFAEAASLCEGAMTALPFLRDHGRIEAGAKVLINGASGAIGTAAVQIAVHFGTEVTGVCSGRNEELVLSLGADTVIDYGQEDFTRSGVAYDVIFDTVGKSSFAKCKDSLTDRGIYLSPVISLGLLMRMLWTSRFRGKKAVFAATGLRSVKDKLEDMAYLRAMAEAGTLTSIIDRRYALEEAAEAASYVDEGHKVGNVVLVVGHEGSGR
jgi:NADPH:quinone reductase-like Zn-dependent oxidoreductase